MYNERDINFGGIRGINVVFFSVHACSKHPYPARKAKRKGK
jgi:hypothetical protein